ncbi:MAG: uncharacterized protein PWQ29_997 [Verrucomicrobiota bacterium]|jgi:TPR repeat protein|nr:uncharacterized protein [Verrucomicrobiota bacterium]
MKAIQFIFFWVVLSFSVWAQEHWADVSQDKLLTAAQGGDPAAQCELASRYAQTKGSLEEVNSQRAYRWYKKAAEQGYVEAQWRLGSTRWSGLDFSHEARDREQRREWLKKAAIQGHQKSKLVFCRDLPGVSKDDALNQVQHLAGRSGDISDFVVWMRFRSRTSRSDLAPNEVEQVLIWCKELVDQGNAEAAWLLGRTFLLGVNVERDLEQAKNNFEKAQELGYPNLIGLQNSMGDVHRLMGQLEKALVWYKRALENNTDSYILYEKIGDLYRVGEGSHQDDAEALQYYLDGAKAGDSIYASGFYRKIGDMYAEGIGIEKNQTVAREWYAKARDADKRLKKTSQRFEFDPDEYKFEFDPRDYKITIDPSSFFR